MTGKVRPVRSASACLWRGKLDLALLPSARACRADEDGDRTAVRDSLLQGGKPGLAGGKLVAVEKGDEPGLCQV